jgi:hypothetical protein
MAELNSEKAESSPGSSDINPINNLETALHLPVNRTKNIDVETTQR